METFFPFRTQYRNCLFKSYYVVWKRDTPLITLDVECGLNRTMQYGNEEDMCYEKKVSVQFKSYYVVWKPTSEVSLSLSQISFKSYYVVWKHIAPAPAIIAFSLFKSYYVVWKLRPQNSAVIFRIRRLNRTMQYGNNKNFHIAVMHQLSLNRTMQYGNCFSSLFCFILFLV